MTHNKQKPPWEKKRVYRTILVLYLLLLFYLTWFPGPFRQAGGYVGINLHPFATIRLYMRLHGPAVWINLAGNLAAFLPLGFLWPRCFSRYSRWWHTALASLGTSLLVETVQYLSAMGSLDVDDLIVNFMGGLAGYFLHLLSRWVYDNTHYTHGA